MSTDNTRAAAVDQDAAHKLDRHLAMLAMDRSNARLYRTCVDTAVSQRRFDVVVTLARERLAVEPAHANALFDLATGLIGQGEYRAALETLGGLNESAAADAAVRFNQALCHYALREFEAARPHLEYNYEQGRQDAVALRLLASTYHHLGLLDEGLSIAKNHADTARGDAALAGVYALLFFDADDIASATRHAETALRLDPKSIEGRIVRAAVLTMRAQMDRARDLLEGVLEDAPRNGRAWINLASLTLLDRDFVTARQQVERGLETMPTHLGSWHLLAWTHLFAGDVDAAERTFNHALELDRTFGETHGALAAIAAIKGEREKAERLRDVAMRLDPDGMSAYFAEAVLAGSAGDPEQARRILTGAASQLEARHGSALTKLLVRSATNAKPPAP